MEEGFLKRYLLYEIQKINSGNVRDRKKLGTLLKMETPHAVSADGNKYKFEKSVLKEIAGKLKPEMLEKILLPINFYFNTSCKYCYYINDKFVYEMFVALGDFDNTLTFNEGKLWFYKHVGNRIRKKYPTLIQIVVMPVLSPSYSFQCY